MAVRRQPKRGLVLGGGGMLGAAWMVGALCALEEVHGFDPRSADVIVGTSAGSVLTALLGAGVTAAQLRDHQRGIRISHGPLAGFSWDYERATGDGRPQLPKLIPTSRRSLASSARRLRQLPPTAVLASFLPQGRGSLERIQHLVEAITPMDEWSPHPNAWVVAMDLDEGRRVAFGRPEAPAVPLATAVMASCAIPSWFRPVEINGHSYVDGGACSATNVDLVADMGLDEVYVLAPMVSFAMNKPDSVLARMEHRWRVQITKRCLHETEKVREQGAAVIALGPGPEDLDAMGPNLMDVKRRLPVLETSMRTSVEALRDPDRVGPDHLADVG
ncbi:MAG: Patatin-like phospholipase family protein [Actinomycetota bacterium]|nr:Patatin-like phospholipase family protein [Actinomycetota bacterium]